MHCSRGTSEDYAKESGDCSCRAYSKDCLPGSSSERACIAEIVDEVGGDELEDAVDDAAEAGEDATERHAGRGDLLE